MPPEEYDAAAGVANRVKLYRQLANESDRGIVLSALALIEWHLKILVRHAIHEPPGNGKERDAFKQSFFGPSGYASSLSSAAKFCVATELINDDTYIAIERLRKIRNLFAHSYDDATFDHEDVRKFLDKIPKDSGFGEDVREGPSPTEAQLAFADVGETKDQVRDKLGEDGPQSITIHGCWDKLHFIFAAAAIEDAIMQKILELTKKRRRVTMC